MNPEKDKEFQQNMNHLVKLLKKIIGHLPSQGPFSSVPGEKDSSINLNLCFFTFLPIGPEDLDELEEIYDQYFFDDKPEEFSSELTPSDLDFLRANGIQF